MTALIKKHASIFTDFPITLAGASFDLHAVSNIYPISMFLVSCSRKMPLERPRRACFLHFYTAAAVCLNAVLIQYMLWQSGKFNLRCYNNSRFSCDLLGGGFVELRIVAQNPCTVAATDKISLTKLNVIFLV